MTERKERPEKEGPEKAEVGSTSHAIADVPAPGYGAKGELRDDHPEGKLSDEPPLHKKRVGPRYD